jgi:hypothetical protein
MAFTILKKLQNDFVHHVDIQVKIFKPSPFLLVLKPIKLYGHCNGNHKV